MVVRTYVDLSMVSLYINSTEEEEKEKREKRRIYIECNREFRGRTDGFCFFPLFYRVFRPSRGIQRPGQIMVATLTCCFGHPIKAIKDQKHNNLTQLSQ